MKLAIRLAAFLFLATGYLAVTLPVATADEAVLRETIAKFADVRNFNDTEAVINELGALGDPQAAPALRALGEGDLYFLKSDNSVVIGLEEGRVMRLADPVSQAPLGEVGTRDVKKIRVRNSLRRAIDAVLSGLTLRADDPAVRMSAADTIFLSADVSAIEALEVAIAAETDPRVKARMQAALASATLASERAEADKLEAIAVLAALGGRETISLLRGYQDQADGVLAEATGEAIAQIERQLQLWEIAQNVWYGLSLGSVLLLAAIGLAITFGVMGVINMAHGEMVMIGAYTTFVVQEIIRTSAPGLFDYSLAIALPLAFLAAALVGLAIERGVIRFLYGRPLETLLATWGISLILQQSVRTIFGPTNQEVGNPSWMSGAFEIGELSITWNRFWIFLFSMAVFLILWLVVNRSSLGLQMRAVTQNRRMAAAMGIRTPWVDAMTFALGSGIAGIAGVALSQIGNVSPNLGQGYIIDSFMVVVFGGVGNLWGTLVGAMTLGVVNKFLEPYAGAVLAKILVLVLIILFIQKRPRGLFALKGRAVEQ